MTNDQIEAERVAFEARMTADFGKLCFRRGEFGRYREWIQDRWIGWLARAEEQYASEADAVQLMERQEPQRLAMEAKHERGE